ncbi:eukaryotic translation initiation factor 2 subunit 2-like [Argiope bruennichi]|uniref:Eukaryotic translation initiation factor 2 subunit 2 n=1 Tax=Argiope bruennichi TaxID=94029 RepID=A0A8T0E2Y0_ARGBR|nr:eukaryotic translation initiation factor 2 subunit 2-like [Argiope bruennichi]XP_055938321.1 eukaryotic translation initiation factor 2 subunit 2-like [Argiope bruennichi]KAF8763634.1 Eukaryotic translation initiation factor 2 like protein [Argiope bruennichi]
MMEESKPPQIDEDFPPELLEFIGQKKKKKVRFLPVGLDSVETVKKDSEIISNDSPDEPSALNVEDDLSFQSLKKKKKKKRSNIDELPSSIADSVSSTIDAIEISSMPTSTDNDADYTYESLLKRVFDIMREKDPNRDVECKKKLIMKPPQILRIGTKKSSFVNFIETCRLLHRLPQHVQSFLLVELGTSGSVDGNNQLIIKGRFDQKQIESVLRSYIKEYVTCHTCRSPDTILQKDTRLFFLQCESCGSRCSVASIKSGFQALTGKRAAMRAKAT